MIKTIFLLGHPVGHSISPIFQQVALDYHNLPMVYRSIDVFPDKLEETINFLRQQDFIGANVTVPHKETVFDLLDEVDDTAKIVGAVNTIENQSGKLIGLNTDVDGFIMSLEKNSTLNPSGKTCVVIGAGGSARAVIIGLLRVGVAHITIFNRTFSRATNLANTLNPEGHKIQAIDMQETDLFKRLVEQADLIVNCTSIGMKGGPDTEKTPVPVDIISAKSLITDLVYNPEQTPLIKGANKAGANVLTGLSMLVYQGAISFEIWTGKKAPVDQMFMAAQSAINKQAG